MNESEVEEYAVPQWQPFYEGYEQQPGFNASAWWGVTNGTDYMPVSQWNATDPRD